MAKSLRKKKHRKGLNVLGANQYMLDPRQQLCWDYYVNPKSATFGNAFKSAMKAGYKKSHSLQITTEMWWLEKARRLGLLSKAEKVLEETLVMEHIGPAIGPFGPIIDKETGQIVMKVYTNVLKIKQDSAKFVAETQGKKQGYTKKTDVDVTTGGEKLNSFNETQLQRIASRLLNGNTPVKE